MRLKFVRPLVVFPAVLALASCAPTGPENLLAGAKWEYSPDRGQTWSRKPPTVRGGDKKAFYVRASFHVEDASGYAALALTHGAPPRQRQLYRLNDQPIHVPVRGMCYRTIPAIPPSLLKPGLNTLFAKVGIDNRPPPKERAEDMPPITLRLATRLAALKHEDLRIQSGPVVGACGPDFFSLTCRTNMPAQVTLTARQIGPDAEPLPRSVVQVSSGPLVHRFRVAGLDRRTHAVAYTLTASNGRFLLVKDFGPVRLPKSAHALRILAMGDSRTYRRKWAAVAAAALKAAPDLIAFSGDMVSSGRNDWQWDEHFFSAAPEMFATIPFYAVIGNHEESAPAYPLLFHTPGEDGLATNWAQDVGPALLIGIDYRDDWAPGGEPAGWLEKALARSEAKFIFLFSHYPAWTTGKHGKLNRKGLPASGTVRKMRDCIVPLLTKYRATAMIVGHDHMYERSELPGGLTHIISGGAGAPLRDQTSTAARQNPYSKAFAKKLHYCLLEITGDVCTLGAYDLDGKKFDARTWEARKAD